jgi:outer membrane protein assembly factor BamD (BamD/ComL family)
MPPRLLVGRRSRRGVLAPLLLVVCLTGCGRVDRNQPPRQLIDEGWSRYSLGDYDLASRAFAAAAARPECSPDLRLQALYGQASALDHDKASPDPDRAAALYEQVAARASDSDLAAWSLLALARMQYVLPPGTLPDPAQVAAAYQRVIDRFPRRPAGEEAFLLLQALRLERNDAAAAGAVLASLDAFIAGHPQSCYLSTAYTLRAHSARLLGRPRQRLDSMIESLQSLETDPRHPELNLAATYWQIAATAEFDLGDFPAARRYYRKLIADYPTDQKTYLAQLELRHMDQVEADLRTEATTQPAGNP